MCPFLDDRLARLPATLVGIQEAQPIRCIRILGMHLVQVLYPPAQGETIDKGAEHKQRGL